MKFFDSFTDRETGLSEVILEHRDEAFIGQACCCEEDNFSELIGCHYAEIRAMIKVFKYDLKIARLEYKACKEFADALNSYKNVNFDKEAIRAIRKQLYVRKRKIEDIKTSISNLKVGLDKAIKTQDKISEIVKERSKNN